MTSQKNPEGQLEKTSSLREEQKSKAKVAFTAAEVSEQQAQFLIPYRLELAGNRLSPLHEW
jgi:hypothetical protein